MILRITARARCAIKRISLLLAAVVIVVVVVAAADTTNILQTAEANPLAATVQFGASQAHNGDSGNLRPLGYDDFELTRGWRNKNLQFKQVPTIATRIDATLFQHQQAALPSTATTTFVYNLPGAKPAFDTQLLFGSKQYASGVNTHNGTRLAPGPLRKALMSLQNPKLLGGDILLRTGRPRKDRVIKFERSALVSQVSLWPRGIIFYELDESVAHLSDLIWKVMQQFHDETCIRFIPRRQNEPDYIRLEALKGCSSYIGRIGGEQTVSLGDGCEYRGTIAHELLHSAGFFHHQNRSDRDEYLEILWDNIARGKESQFMKMAPHENLLLNKFDYNSIMLYGPHTFGRTLDRVTMKPKQEGVTLLEVMEKQGLSELDIDNVNKLYECKNLTRK